MYRREFLKTSLTERPHLRRLQSRVFAAGGEKPLRVGLIGCGWYGKTDLFHLIQVAPVEVVGLCDVDSHMLAAGGGAWSASGSHRRSGRRRTPIIDKLLSAEQPEIVLIGTPDHWHCLPMVEACKAGADVYAQKPISYDVVEGQAMVAAARKYKRTVQVGSAAAQHAAPARGSRSSSSAAARSAKSPTWTSTVISARRATSRRMRPPPEHLDWNTYVGPATWREYNPAIHPRAWRDCREFSNGQTGDLCVHFFDVVRYFLDLGWPRHDRGVRRQPDA